MHPRSTKSERREGKRVKMYRKQRYGSTLGSVRVTLAVTKEFKGASKRLVRALAKRRVKTK